MHKFRTKVKQMGRGQQRAEHGQGKRPHGESGVGLMGHAEAEAVGLDRLLLCCH